MLHHNKLFLLFLCINLSVTAMQNADHIITEGTEEQIIALLQNGYQYNAKILYKNLELPLLYIATLRGQVEVIKYLQSLEVDINAPITEGLFQGWIPMHIAAANEQIEVIKYLQSQGKDINAPMTEGARQGMAPMHIAAAEGQIEVIKYLQSQGLGINAPMTEGPRQGMTPMHAAAAKGQIEVIKYLQSQGLDINALITEEPRQGFTPMHIAASNGQVEVIKYLQSHGLDINIKIAREDQFKGMTALCLATRGSLPAIQTLVWLGAQLDHLGPDSEQSAYQYAEMEGKVENVLYLTKIAPHTQSLFTLCLQLNKYLQSLYQILSEENISYTELATYTNKCSIVATIANLLSQFYRKTLDAHYSKAYAHYTLCEKLAAAIRKEIDYSWCGCGAELNAIDRFGKTALHYCIQVYHPKAPTSFDELAKDIIKKGAKVNIVDRDGFTPLGRACLHGNYRLVRLLLSQDKEHRADPTIGINPLYIALTTNNWPLMNVLLKLAQ